MGSFSLFSCFFTGEGKTCHYSAPKAHLTNTGNNCDEGYPEGNGNTARTRCTLTKLQGPYMELPKTAEVLRLWAKP